MMKAIPILLLFVWSGTLNAQVPDRGIQLNASTGTTFQRIGNCNLSVEPVTGQSFSEALRVVVPGSVSNAWDAQVKFPAVAGIEENDVVLVVFYARTISSVQETGEGALTVCIEHNVTYAKELYYTITIGQEWKAYYAPVQATTSLADSSVNYAFHTGFPSQTIEVAHIRFLNYKNTLALEDLPVTEITYAGQAPDASWRAPAQERINQYRKGAAAIVVYDKDGSLLPGANISVEMTRHQFGFGTAIAASTFNSNNEYRNKVYELFNEVVFENDLKWPQFNPDAGNEQLNLAFDSLAAHHMDVRGHNVIWPSFSLCPPAIELLKDDPVALRNAIDERIVDVTSFTSGRVVDWDVINEPYTNHDLQDILGDGVMADWFKRVRRTDRGVKRYLNDYSILSAGGKDQAHQDYFYDVIRYIDSLGGGIEGIGMQGHFGSELTSINRVYEILERYAALGKEIKITEHDIDVTQRGVQSEYTRDFMTIVFSHPSVKSILVWGFWEGRHWRPDAAFYDSSWTIRPHGEVWRDMIHTTWWTPAVNGVSDEQGKITFDGFLGTYAYTVTSGEVVRTGTFTLDHSHQSGIPNDIAISLDESIPEKVWITPSKEGYLCEGEELILQAPEGEGLNYTWYRNDTLLSENTPVLSAGTAGSYRVKVTKGALEFISSPFELEVRASPESSISLSGDPSLCLGESILISTVPQAGVAYEWMNGQSRIAGEITSIEVSQPGIYKLIASSNGCSSSSESVNVTVGIPKPLSIEALGELTFCEGEETILRIDPEPGRVYIWKNGDTIVEPNNFRIHATKNGSYTASTVTEGCLSTSEPVVVTVLPSTDPQCATGIEPDPPAFRIYPNPFQGTFHLELTSASGQGTCYRVFNSVGQLILGNEIEPGTSQLSISIPDPGLYLLRVDHPKSFETFKLVAK